MRKVVHKFEMVRLSVSVFQLRFTTLSCTLALFGIMVVSSREGTDRNLMNFLGYKIPREHSPNEVRPVGEYIPYISRHPPRSSEHPADPKTPLLEMPPPRPNLTKGGDNISRRH